MTNFQDKTLKCAECSEKFVFTAEDQEFFDQKGYTEPKRCPACRANRKGNDSRGGGNSRPHSRERDYNKPQFTVICSECGRETTVPFEPRNDRPVYCSDCYKKNKN